MKLEKLFKKLESFFEMGTNEQKENKNKKEKLKTLLIEKIDNKKQKIKSASREKKERLKDELKMIKKLFKQYNM